MAKLSILDLAAIAQGNSAASALHNTLAAAQHAERLGYQRYWVAEHHNMPGIASSATAVLIAYLAGGTSRIRLGAGGVMLPNHAPLVIAEQFGTLAELYPQRIDLGLGRAPGTDQLTSRALRRTLSGNVDDFPQDVLELQQYFQPLQPGQAVQAVPGVGTQVPLWILGSSLYGAQLAASLGLPYSFASHFAPQQMQQAIAVYRQQFQPSEQLQEPYVMLGYNVCAAETDEHALYLRSSGLQSFVNLRRGVPGKLPPPVRDFEQSLAPMEQAMLAEIGRCSAVGSPATVKDAMANFIETTGADELMLVSHIYDHHQRLRSMDIAASVGQELGLIDKV